MNKIVFFDVDDTLFDEGKKIPASAKQAIRELKQRDDVEVAIATGRAPTMFRPVLEELGINSYVSCNGAYVVYRGKEIHKEKFDLEALSRLEERAKSLGHPMVFSSPDKLWANVESSPSIEESMNYLDVAPPQYGKAMNQGCDIYYALLYCKAEEEAYIHEYGNFRYIRWHRTTMDVILDGGSKAKGIQAMLDHTGLGREHTIAFGDSLNDIEMLKFVGTGVAMGNGRKEAKEAADFVTLAVSDDGIQHGLKKLGLL